MNWLINLKPWVAIWVFSILAVEFNLIGNLPQWGLAWIKVDGAYIHLIDTEEDKRIFIEAMYWATRQIDLPLIAERVETSGELAILNKIVSMGQWALLRRSRFIVETIS